MPGRNNRFHNNLDHFQRNKFVLFSVQEHRFVKTKRPEFGVDETRNRPKAEAGILTKSRRQRKTVQVNNIFL